MGVKVRQRVKGRGKPWTVFWHHNRRRGSALVGDKRAAEYVASQIRRKLKARKFDVDAATRKSEIPEFSAYAQHYLGTYAKTACKRNTWKNYETIIKLHLTPAWNGKRLDQITRADVKQLLLQKQQAGLAPATVENVKALISGIFTHAYEDEILTVNPALKLGKYIQKQDRRRHIRPLTREQVAQFLQAVQEHFSDYYPLLLTAFRTGMRLGELLGLAWADIDFAANSIHVQRSYSHGHWSTTKSHKSRLVDMDDPAEPSLKIVPADAG